MKHIPMCNSYEFSVTILVWTYSFGAVGSFVSPHEFTKEQCRNGLFLHTVKYALSLVMQIFRTPFQTRSLLSVFERDALGLKKYTQGLHGCCQRVMKAQVSFLPLEYWNSYIMWACLIYMHITCLFILVENNYIWTYVILCGNWIDEVYIPSVYMHIRKLYLLSLIVLENVMFMDNGEYSHFHTYNCISMIVH